MFHDFIPLVTLRMVMLTVLDFYCQGTNIFIRLMVPLTDPIVARQP